MNETQLKKQLIIKRKNIRHKLNLLKNHDIKHDFLFSPVTKHLVEIEETLKKPKNKQKTLEVFEEPKSKKEHDTMKHEISQTKMDILKNIDFTSGDETDEYSNSETSGSSKQSQTFKSRKEEMASNSLSEYLEQYDPLPRKYVAGILSDDKKNLI